MFIAALFIIAKSWKQLRCPFVDEWINKLWYIQPVEYYIKLKRNELSSHEMTWRKLKCILLSQRSQPEKATYCIIPSMGHSGKGNTMKTIERSVIAKG